MLYPAFRMQTEMMNAVGGQAWWNSKKGKLANEKEEAKQKEYAERVAQARMLEKARQKQIKKHMGAIKYYLMPPRANTTSCPPPRQRPVRRPVVTAELHGKSMACAPPAIPHPRVACVTRDSPMKRHLVVLAEPVEPWRI